jgi:hypothetical protein
MYEKNRRSLTKNNKELSKQTRMKTTFYGAEEKIMKIEFNKRICLLTSRRGREEKSEREGKRDSKNWLAPPYREKKVCPSWAEWGCLT